MKFEVTTALRYEATIPSTLLLNIKPLHFKGQLVTDEMLRSEPELTNQELCTDTGEKRLTIIQIPMPCNFSISYSATVENNIIPIPAEQLHDVPIAIMPAKALSYLNPSRYCQSDKLYKFAHHKFGRIDNAFQKVVAVCDWIHRNVEYNGGGFTTAQTTAHDTITEQIGVCRDFAHLGIALCRALTIPARYLTAYAYQLQPADFHACFEAYLGGHWIIFDPTKLAPINGLVKVATGYDAAETAVASSFGNLLFQSLEVNANQIGKDFQRMDYNTGEYGYSFGNLA